MTLRLDLTRTEMTVVPRVRGLTLNQPRLGTAMAVSKLLVLAILLTTTACSTHQFGLASAGPREEIFAAALVGSWGMIDAPGDKRTDAAYADTAVWTIGPQGQLLHSQVRVRMRAGMPVADERVVQTARWWVKSPERNSETGHVLCTSARPGRGSQCGRITIDTSDATGGGRETRLTWSGLTFRSQHWVFVRRSPATPSPHPE